MTRYTVAETFLYEIDAATPEEAVELFRALMESGEDDMPGARFVDNELAVLNEQGQEL